MENYYFKENVSLREYEMYKYVCLKDIVDIPDLIGYDNKDNILITRKIKNLDISNMHGEELEDLTEKESVEVFNKIRKIIKKLYDNNIVYPDITGYNFIEDNNKIWIIDLEHARFKDDNVDDSFVVAFINGLNNWNPDFR